MKKVLHISKYYFPFSGGTEQIARDVVLSLKDSCEQKVIAFNDGKEDKIDFVDDIEIIKCGCFAKISAQSLSISYRKQLHKVIEEFNPDIVIFHYPNPFVASFLLKELKNRDIKLVVYWHLDIIRQKFLRVLFNGQNRKLLERADKVIATSPNYIEGSKWLQSVKEKCVVVPNCINVERMELSAEIKERAEKIRKENKGKTICVAVGRHTEYKGFTYLIKYYFSMCSLEPNKNFRWIAEVARKNPQMEFAVAGSINETVFADGLGFKCPDNMELLGYVTDEEAKSLMRNCISFIFPTFYEGFGIPPLEAISAGAQSIIVSDTEIMHEIFGDNVNYIDPNNYEMDITKFFNITNEGKKQLLNKYSWEKSAKVLYEFLCTLR